MRQQIRHWRVREGFGVRTSALRALSFEAVTIRSLAISARSFADSSSAAAAVNTVKGTRGQEG
eukprot:6194141-Pleurochrysis_carterae.AAC.4